MLVIFLHGMFSKYMYLPCIFSHVVRLCFLLIGLMHATQAAIREHLIGNLGVSAEELDPPRRPSGRGMGRLDADGFGTGELEEEDGQQVNSFV